MVNPTISPNPRNSQLTIEQQQQQQLSSSSAHKQRKELQRKIFLNTMRNVYPNSIRIKYIFNYDENRFVIHPLSVQDKCRSVPDTQWFQLTSQLNEIWRRHVVRRERIHLALWSIIVFSIGSYVAFGLTNGWMSIMPTQQNRDMIWYPVFGWCVAVLMCLLGPNLAGSFFVMRPMLKQFEEWKQQCIISLDKYGIEIVKITSGEILSERARYKLMGMIYYGSSAWFRYEDSEVEVFWRSVKSGKHVRRYSLMITANEESSPQNSSPSPNSSNSENNTQVNNSHHDSFQVSNSQSYQNTTENAFPPTAGSSTEEGAIRESADLQH